MHYAAQCQHNDEYSANRSPDKINDIKLCIDSVPKFSGNEGGVYDTDSHVNAQDIFINEAMVSAVLDTGCSKTVCGKLWYENYLNHNLS